MPPADLGHFRDTGGEFEIRGPGSLKDHGERGFMAVFWEFATSIESCLDATLRAGAESPAAVAGLEHLKQQIKALAVVGRLRVSEDRAADLMRAAGRGTVLTLLEMPENRRDLGLSELAQEAVIAAIVTDLPALHAAGVTGAAVALRASLPAALALTGGERVLLKEWLDRLAQNSEIS